MNPEAGKWIDRLGLMPHPEGGYYRVTYESAGIIPRESLPDSYKGPRRYSTAIYFLIDGPENFSAFHRIASDEMWHFYAGTGLTVHIIDPEGNYSERKLGPAGEFQMVVSGGCWFASSIDVEEGFALVGCTVAPGFDFADFELAKRQELMALYPRHAAVIERLTRK